MSAVVDAPRTGWGEHVRRFTARTVALTAVELQKLRNDRVEMVMRAVQPVLWLLVFGTIFSRVRGIPTGELTYLEYLTPGILAQSALFVSIFLGIHIIWDRDSGVLPKVMATPTPRQAIVAAKALSAGIRGLAPVLVIVPVALLMGVSVTVHPLRILAAALALMLGAGFFACLSITIAGLARTRDRLMGIGQVITMPLFFASNALYPIEIMPGWLQVMSLANPLTYLVDALRGLLVGAPANLWLDFAVLGTAMVGGVAVAGALLPRLVR